MPIHRTRFLVIALVLIVLWLVPQTPARAATLHYHDLTSLALESDAIVLAKITGVRPDGTGYGRIHTHEVVESLFGELVPGDVIDVNYGALRLASEMADEDEWTPDDEVVLFLDRPKDGEQLWWLVPSGLRIFADGITYRFEQFSNPGPYFPAPQGDDPYDVFEDPRGREQLTRAEFEPQLRAAIDRATAVRRDLAAIQSPEAQARLFEVIGPAWGTDDDEPCVIHGEGPFEDLVSKTILEALWAAGENEALLEGYSRLRGGVDRYTLRVQPDASWLLESASQRERPLHLRVAALQLLGEEAVLDAGVANALVPLLSDPEPSVRMAAAFSVHENHVTPSWRAAIVERLRVESDPSARYALVEVALDHDLLAEAGLADEMDERWPVVTAERRGRALILRWIGPGLRWNIEAFTVTARPSQGEARSLQLVPSKEVAEWNDGRGKGVRGWLLFAEPLPEGRVDLELVAELRRRGHTREVRLDLRPLGMPPPPPFVKPSEIVPTPVPAGCACTATSSPAGSFGWFVLVLAACLRRGNFSVLVRW